MITAATIRARVQQQRRQANEAAKVFARICREGDAAKLYNAHLLLNESEGDAWRLAMMKVAKLPQVSSEIRSAFVPIWVETKMLSLHIGNRRVLANALRVLMPGNYSGPPLALYRGADGDERCRRLYGFSWTTDVAIAREFAEHWAQPVPSSRGGVPWPSEGVILKALAPPEAILLVRQPEDYYDEGEVVVDPFRLGKIEVLERLRNVPNPSTACTEQ